MPTGLSASARKMWSDVMSQFDLDDHEVILLHEACRSLTLIDALDAISRREGPILKHPKTGVPTTNPAVIEARNQRVVLTRIIATLGLSEDGRAANRNRTRGVYRLPDRGVA